MVNQSKAILCVVGLVAAVATACLIPDRDIVVIVTDPCGEEWAVQTIGAFGYNGLGEPTPIKTEDKKWISKSYCLNAAQAEDMADPTSELAAELLSDIVHVCQARAVEMGIADTDDTCVTTADIAYFGTCMSPPAGCDDGTDDGETGETGGTETGADPGGVADFGSLDLQTQVYFVDGEYVVSQLLITTALADVVGVVEDGTFAAQLSDVRGTAYGFEILGVEAGNLGDVLGLRDGDVVVEVAGRPSATYEDLLEVAAVLFDADRASVVIERGGATMTQRYRRDVP